MFWDVFDNLGFWMAANFFAFLSFFTFFLFPFSLVGLLASQNKIIENKPLYVREFFKDSRRCGWRPLGLFLIQIAAVSLGIFNIYFYSSHLGILGLFLLIGSVLVELFLHVLFFFAYPILLFNHTVLNSLKLAFVLTVKHLGKVVLFLLVSLLITFILSLSVVAVPVIMWAVLASFWGNLFEQIRRVEEGLEERPLHDKTFKEVFFPFH